MATNLNAWPVRDIKNMLSLLDYLEAAGITELQAVKGRLRNHVNAEIVKKRVQAAKVITAEQKRVARQVRAANKLMERVRCKTCGAQAIVQPVNVSPSTQTGDLSEKIAISCTNRKCLEVEYSTLSITDYLGGSNV